ncbi:MAG: GNAT family N-acetyltransferase [Clostridia bacterium]|nr:GNAT family N-acetyltransferase [Clostridia bacterium]
MGRPIIKKACIQTERLVLQPFRPEDRERLVEMMQDPEITKTFMVPDYPKTRQFYELADKLISFSRIEDTTHLEYGIYLDDRMIGFVNDCGFDDSALEVGYVIDPAYKGRGYATEALKAVIGELREMGFRKVLAGFFEGNTGSRRVMEKCGMHLNGNVDEEEYRGQTLTCYECEMEL